MVDLSIIVPIYNVRSYLTECIDSLLKIEGITKQIVCVEDASTDGSSELLIERYSNEDNVTIISNKQNRGLSYSRNIGLRNAIGKYVMFVDSDDIVNSDSICELLVICEKENLEILYFDVEEFDDSTGTRSDRRRRKGKYDINTGADIFVQMMNNNEMFGCVWDGIYRRTLIEKNNLCFINGILHEDIPFTFEAMMSAMRVGVKGCVGYYYRQRKDSILHQPNYLARSEGLLLDYFQMMIVWKKHIFDLGNNEIEKNVRKYFNSVLSMFASNMRKCQYESIDRDSVIGDFVNNFTFNETKDFELKLDEGWIEKVKKYDCIGLYGAGNVAHELIPLLVKRGIGIKNILVTNKNTNSDSLFDISVVEYSNEMNDVYDAIIVGVRGDACMEIEDFLKSQGYDRQIIHLPV